QPVVDFLPFHSGAVGPIDPSRGSRVEDPRIARMNGDGDHDVDFLHTGHSFFPFTPAIFGKKGAHRRGGVDLLVVSRMKDKLIDKRYVFFESDVVGEPMLPAIR